MQFTTFYVGNTFFGINILQVKEINNNMRLTPVPDSPESIKGLMNLRGQIITIFDLSVRLGRQATGITKNTRNLIMKTDAETLRLRSDGLLTSVDLVGNDGVGFIVDEIGDVVEVDADEIEPAPANVQDVQKEFISGVVELEDRLLILLKVAELIDVREEF